MVPTPTRHPVALADPALTTRRAVWWTGEPCRRLAHAANLKSIYGLPPRRSVSYLADYLSTLGALMTGDGPTPNDSSPITARLGGELPTPPPVLLAALGPRMLELAGSRTARNDHLDDRDLDLTGYVVPHIRAAADAAGQAAAGRRLPPGGVTRDVEDTSRALPIDQLPLLGRSPPIGRCSHAREPPTLARSRSSEATNWSKPPPPSSSRRRDRRRGCAGPATPMNWTRLGPCFSSICS